MVILDRMAAQQQESEGDRVNRSRNSRRGQESVEGSKMEDCPLEPRFLEIQCILKDEVSIFIFQRGFLLWVENKCFYALPSPTPQKIQKIGFSSFLIETQYPASRYHLPNPGHTAGIDVLLMLRGDSIGSVLVWVRSEELCYEILRLKKYHRKFWTF